MSDLEREYRKALARYPRTWRRDHEEALLGVLLDNAEAEGRDRMSRTDRRDLAANGRRLRLARALPWVLFTIAALALLSVTSLLQGGAPLDTVFLFSPPVIPAPPIGGTYHTLFVISLPAWALYVISVGVLVVAAVAALMALRRLRREQ